MGVHTTSTTKMKTAVIIAAFLVVFAYSNEGSTTDEAVKTVDTELSHRVARDAVAGLYEAVPQSMSPHAQRINSLHEELLQAHSKKAYRHNMGKLRAPLLAALKILIGDLRAGHSHDKKALHGEKRARDSAINKSYSTSKSKVRGYKHKVCPAMRAEEAALSRRNAAKAAMGNVKKGKICSGGLKTTLSDMGVERPSPRLGSELSSAWARKRAEYTRSQGKYHKAVKEYNSAKSRRISAMNVFKAACSLEATNTHNDCLRDHKVYNKLKSEVASNVAMRKAVYVSVKVIECYANNLSSNAGAKSWANRMRANKAMLRQWDITPQ